MQGRPDAAELVRAFEDGRSAGDVEAMAVAAMALAAQRMFGTQLDRTPAFLHEAYQQASGTLRIRLAAALARTWVYGSEPERAVPFAAEAVAAASGLDDPELLAEALDAQLLVHWGPDDLAERLRITSRLADVVAHVAGTEARLSSHLWRLTTALESLDAVTLRRQLQALGELADETGSARVRMFADSRRAMHALIADDLDAARTLAASTVAAGAAAGEPDTEALDHELSAAIARQAGDRVATAALAAAFELFGTAQGIPSIMAEAAWLWLDSGSDDRARAVLDQVAGGGLGAVARDVDWLLTVALLTRVAAGTGATSLAAEGVELLTPYAGRAVVNAGAVTFHGVVEDHLAAGCTALGRAAEAAEWARRAAAGYARIGAAWWARRLDGPAPGAGGPAPAVAHLVPGVAGVWTVGAAGATVGLREMKGFRYLRILLQRPGADVPVLELAASVAGRPADAAPVDRSLGDVLDRQALAAYRERLRELDEELAEARSWADEGRLAALTAERDMLLDEVTAATGLAGRPRQVGGSSERARVAVQKALAAAIGRIAEVDPALGRLLRDCVRTGSTCGYQPDPARPVRWVLDA